MKCRNIYLDLIVMRRVHTPTFRLNLTHKKIPRCNPCRVVKRQAKNLVESSYASPVRLYLDVISVTGKRTMSF